MGTCSFHNQLSGQLGTGVRCERQCERERRRRRKEREGGGEKERGEKDGETEGKEEKERAGDRKKPPEGNTGKNSLASLRSNDYQVFFHPLL